MYQYKCVPAPMNLVVKNVSDMEQAVKNYASLLNDGAQDGWVFYSMETITCTKPAGCLMKLLGMPDTVVSYNVLIFMRQRK